MADMSADPFHMIVSSTLFRLRPSEAATRLSRVLMSLSANSSR